MARRLVIRRPKVGAAPGTVVFSGERRVEHAQVRVLRYSPDHCEEETAVDLDEVLDRPRLPGELLWINIDGLHDTVLLQRLGARLDIHPLVQEDIVQTAQRPKYEDYDDFLYLVLRMLQFDETVGGVRSEQISIVLFRDMVISFQEQPGDVFEVLRERLRGGKGRMRRLGPDYLAYTLIDAVVDHAFLLLDRLGAEIDPIEACIEDGDRALVDRIHSLRRELILVRRSVGPLREVLSGLLRGETELVQESTVVYLRDVYDHTVQLAEAVEVYRDLLSGLQDLNISTISHRMNEVIKLLTVLATIFVPLTFVSGVYGMNFAHMPELEWRWSYPLFWLVSLLMAGSMLWYFRRRNWL